MKLSSKVKAEILGSVLHELEHLGKIWEQLDPSYQTVVKRALRECSMSATKFKKSDFKKMRKWFKNNDTHER